MGDHKHNPNASGYTGQLPEFLPGVSLQWTIRATADFVKKVAELRAAGVEGEIPWPESDREVVMIAMASWTVPQATIDRRQGWPTSNVEFMEMGRMPLREFKLQHKKNFEESGLKHCADTIVVQDETLIVES